MKYLTADFGSTYTKLTAIDGDKEEVLATALAFTTIETDVMEGFNAALDKINAQLGHFDYDKLLCCSSAAGGLKMIALGLVPELTSKAAKMAAASAGAKVVKTYSFEISKKEQQEIYEINPDLVLLCGGTDGGNNEVIIANAKRLSTIDRGFSVIIAGNKSAADEIEDIFSSSDKNWVITDNVMPQFNKLNIEPAKQKIRELFISRIIEAKGLSQVQSMCNQKILPTPLAVLNACALFSNGTKNIRGIGEFMAVDVGGATTDVYSMADGSPTKSNVTVKGLPEPYKKRTVEGDLGMRYSLSSLVEEVDLDVMSDKINVSRNDIEKWVSRCTQNPELVAGNETEKLIDETLAYYGIDIATKRHCGVFESVFTPVGQIFALTGKDLTDIHTVIGIGGVIINSDNPCKILQGVAKDSSELSMEAKPANPKYMLDKKYIFASMGLLSEVDADLALKIMKKEITFI